jgi:hypothetical protein
MVMNPKDRRNVVRSQCLGTSLRSAGIELRSMDRMAFVSRQLLFLDTTNVDHDLGEPSVPEFVVGYVRHCHESFGMRNTLQCVLRKTILKILFGEWMTSKS